MNWGAFGVPFLFDPLFAKPFAKPFVAPFTKGYVIAAPFAKGVVWFSKAPFPGI